MRITYANVSGLVWLSSRCSKVAGIALGVSRKTPKNPENIL